MAVLFTAPGTQFTINASFLFLSKKAKVGFLHPFPEFLMMD